MRIFYSHAKKAYGTTAEARHLSIIKDHFAAMSPVIFDPGQEEKGTTEREIAYFLDVLDHCDVLVFARHRGVVTSGVLQEIDHAIAKGMPVYELRGDAVYPLREGMLRSSKIDALAFMIREGARHIRNRP